MTSPVPHGSGSVSIANRYGATRTRLTPRNRWILLGIAAVLALSFVAWLALGRGPGADVKVVSFNVTDATQTRVDFQVTKDAASTAKCEVQALDQGHGIVGWQIITVPPSTTGQSMTSLSALVATDSLAVSVNVDTCWISS
ncbi:DUF4307 domain-containing protein [Psychromicrobium xiongbiense]|uniref:DUF4307 domain-containing protein n=1 Tax=Psychromicrobium xiongbiense TaxID=3051184 RepID=UPI002556CDFD|nr:DUF4307 domain-containing protein [Psychromicrobium sp. YIM S02556]